MPVRLTSSRRFPINGGSVRAGFRTSSAEILAGGLLAMEFFVENQTHVQFYLAIGMDRSRLRPSFFSITALVDPGKFKLDDPTAPLTDSGGPATVVKVERDASFRLPLLVNDFVRLEQLAAVLAPSERKVLRILAQRPLPLALTEQTALEPQSKAPTVAGTLTLYVTRNDDALTAQIAELAAALQANRDPRVSAEREQNAARLAALRSPLAQPYLVALRDHPDPVVQMYMARGLTALRESNVTDL